MRDKYRSLSEEEKSEKREYGKNSNDNMSEEKKHRDWTKIKKIITGQKSLNTTISKMILVAIKNKIVSNDLTN